MPRPGLQNRPRNMSKNIQPKMKYNRVIVGRSYRYVPVLFDKLNPPFDVQPGDIVQPVNLPGCPKANTMHMCHVAKNGLFAGMVCTNSLVKV